MYQYYSTHFEPESQLLFCLQITLFFLSPTGGFLVMFSNHTNQSKKLLFEGLVTHKKEPRHCEPVRTLAWQSPGFFWCFRWKSLQFTIQRGDCHGPLALAMTRKSILQTTIYRSLLYPPPFFATTSCVLPKTGGDFLRKAPAETVVSRRKLCYNGHKYRICEEQR